VIVTNPTAAVINQIPHIPLVAGTGNGNKSMLVPTAHGKQHASVAYSKQNRHQV
jgi:hypothetical protein